MAGRITASDLRGHIDEVSADPLFRRCTRSFIDATEITELDIESSVVQGLAIGQGGQLGVGTRRLAIYAPREPGYGLARVFQGFRSATSDMEVMVFRERSKALEFLGVEGDLEILTNQG
jgi:hypothetical protein